MKKNHIIAVLVVVIIAVIILIFVVRGLSSSTENADSNQVVSEASETVAKTADDTVSESTVGMASPIKEYASLDEMNEAAATMLQHPGVMGVTNERFFVIDDGTDKIAEYSFDINGVSYCLRHCPTTLDDISGVYIDGKTAFADKEYTGDIDYVVTDDMMLARWARVEGQFVLMATRTEGYTEEQFHTIAEEIQMVNAIQGEN